MVQIECAMSDALKNDEGLNRRSMFQALAAGAAISSAIPTQAFAQNEPAVATPADYVRDPNRWGTAEVAALFPGFKHLDMRTSGAIIRVRHGGSGPPLLLMHGNPESHMTWYKIAAKLAQGYHVVLPDLRGYGDSSLPEPGPNHIKYSFRAFAQDNVEIMEQLGYRRFFVAGHDRGGRTTFRMCLDHPERVIKATIMDVLPNYHVWTNTSKEWALASWHWLFMAQPEPFPERMMSAAGAEFFLRNRMSIRGGTGLGFLTQTAFDEYVRAYTLKTITGSCRDYRAGATCDFEMDSADKDRKITTPLFILWGARGPDRSNEFINVWRKFATNIEGYEGLPCGHYMQEEVPDRVYDHFVKFFTA
jgi:haloacetate dehalogenase